MAKFPIPGYFIDAFLVPIASEARQVNSLTVVPIPKPTNLGDAFTTTCFIGARYKVMSPVVSVFIG